MKAQAIFRLASGFAVVLILSQAAYGAVTPHALFSEGAVLQQKANVPVWGTTDKQDEVTVTIAGQKVSAKPADGRWKAELAPLEAGGPHVLTIAQGQDKVEIKNVLVG
jgi:sialate O-acetylesterase